MSLVELALSVVVAVFFFFVFFFCLFVCGLNPFLGPPQCLGYICPDHRANFGLLF